MTDIKDLKLPTTTREFARWLRDVAAEVDRIADRPLLMREDDVEVGFYYGLDELAACLILAGTAVIVRAAVPQALRRALVEYPMRPDVSLKSASMPGADLAGFRVQVALAACEAAGVPPGRALQVLCAKYRGYQRAE